MASDLDTPIGAAATRHPVVVVEGLLGSDHLDTGWYLGCSPSGLGRRNHLERARDLGLVVCTRNRRVRAATPSDLREGWTEPVPPRWPPGTRGLRRRPTSWSTAGGDTARCKGHRAGVGQRGAPCRRRALLVALRSEPSGSNRLNVAMVELPPDLPVIERDAVRLVVQDARGHVLLFRTRQLTMPELGHWWELPGGGIDKGETYVDTAVRELREETGIQVRPAQVGRPTWWRTASFRYRDSRRLQHEVVVAVGLAVVTPELDAGQRLDYEKEDYVDYRWWSVAGIVASADRFYPGRLPELLPGFLAGDAIDEPFELWS